MYVKKNVLYWFVVFVFFAATVCFGALFVSASRANAELAEKYSDLQRTHSEAKAQAERGLKYNRELVERSGRAKRRVAGEYREVEKAGKDIERELRSIIEESKALEYVGVDNNGNSCFRVVSGASVAAD